jgi:hypothetical protein
MVRREAGPHGRWLKMLRESWKHLKKAKGPSQKTGIVTALKMVKLILSQGKMKLLLMMMMP